MANPVLVSSGVTVTAASIVPAVEWALNGFAGGVPESVAALLAGLLVAAVHAGINWINNRQPALAPTTPVLVVPTDVPVDPPVQIPPAA